MATIPEGVFLAGCDPNTDPERCPWAQPLRPVRLPLFYMDRTEVTVEAYAECVSAGGCSIEGLDKGTPDLCNWGEPDRVRHPVNCVSWFQAKTFCRWKGKRLPSGLEWEKAARGTDGRKYPWGNDEFGIDFLANVADESLRIDRPRYLIIRGYRDGLSESGPVGGYPLGESPYGVLDMVGNVHEWVSDAAERDGQAHVRGGNFLVPQWFGVSARATLTSDSHNPLTGFRCARSR
ncbi:MAG: formylglycine-generating enzyme family protein [Deltaproteobacteria bacterium]|nr:formylglycine-generating enzyme family protein [Deltaproteobacteria bacterium]